MNKMYFHSYLKSAALCAALVVGVGACAEVDDPQGTVEESEGEGELNALESTLIAELKLPNGREISYYEPAPGTLAIYETGRLEAAHERAPDEASLTAAALYERLSGEKAPASLVRLSESLGAPAAGEAGRTTPVEKAWPIDHGSYRTAFCRPIHRTRFFFDRNVDTGWTDWNVNYMEASAYATRGTVTLRTQAHDQYRTDTLPQGHYGIFQVSTNRGRGHKYGAWIQNVASSELADLCINFHY